MKQQDAHSLIADADVKQEQRRRQEDSASDGRHTETRVRSAKAGVNAERVKGRWCGGRVGFCLSSAADRARCMACPHLDLLNNKHQHHRTTTPRNPTKTSARAA